jgi:hypothetical protein
MTPFMRLLKKIWERHLGTWEEGPEPPQRIRNLAEIFARTNPHATVQEWLDFTVAHAEGAYKEGYVRGFERTERLGPDWGDPDEAAKMLEQLNEAELGNLPPVDGSHVVPVDGVSQEMAARTFLQLSNEFDAAQGLRRGPVR